MNIDQEPISPTRRSNVHFLLASPAHFLALGLGSGLAPKAPGTVGTLWGWLSWLILHNYLSVIQQGAVILVATLLGIWAAKLTAQNLGTADPGCIVWDEVVAFWFVLWLVMPGSFTSQLAAFILFRFFDAVKPPPVSWADQLLKGFGWRGAWGIYLDDFVAAFCTLLTLAAAARVWG